MEGLDWLESILIPVFGSKGAKDNLGKIYAWRDREVAAARNKLIQDLFPSPKPSKEPLDGKHRDYPAPKLETGEEI